jgi:hypothetical protein
MKLLSHEELAFNGKGPFSISYILRNIQANLNYPDQRNFFDKLTSGVEGLEAENKRLKERISQLEASNSDMMWERDIRNGNIQGMY